MVRGIGVRWDGEAQRVAGVLKGEENRLRIDAVTQVNVDRRGGDGRRGNPQDVRGFDAGGDTSGSVVHAHCRGQGRSCGGGDPVRFRGSSISEPRKLTVQGSDIWSGRSVHHVLIKRGGQGQGKKGKAVNLAGERTRRDGSSRRRLKGRDASGDGRGEFVR